METRKNFGDIRVSIGKWPEIAIRTWDNTEEGGDG